MCINVLHGILGYTARVCACVCLCVVRCVCVCVSMCNVRVCARIHVINEHSSYKVFGAKHTFMMLQSSLDNDMKTHETIVLYLVMDVLTST